LVFRTVRPAALDGDPRPGACQILGGLRERIVRRVAKPSASNETARVLRCSDLPMTDLLKQ
jgi:hypothetical protein